MEAPERKYMASEGHAAVKYSNTRQADTDVEYLRFDVALAFGEWVSEMGYEQYPDGWYGFGERIALSTEEIFDVYLNERDNEGSIS